ncbi:MAG TPA: dTMP kinase [Acidimicrobiales bacterium]
MTVGRFLVFEGGEAAGKSTQAARLAERLRAVLTREPGGTAAGAAIRALLLDPDTPDLDDRAEALLMAADRAQHVAQVVRPALEAGRHVVSDRYVGSSLAYQGYGRGLPVDEVRRLSAWATRGLEPDLVVLLDVPAAVAADRAGARPDRLEAAGEAFHRRVAEGYRALAAADPGRWVVVDGCGAPDEVAARVWAAVADRLPDLAAVADGDSGGGAAGGEGAATDGSVGSAGAAGGGPGAPGAPAGGPGTDAPGAAGARAGHAKMAP